MGTHEELSQPDGGGNKPGEPENLTGKEKQIDKERKNSSSQFGPAGDDKRGIFFDALMENIPEGILIANSSDYSFLAASKYAAEALGIDREELLQLTLAQLMQRVSLHRGEELHEISLEEHPLTMFIRDGESIEDEELVLRNTREEMLPISVKGGPITNDSGEVIGGIFSWMDISEREKNREALEAYAQQLERSNKELETFAYSASHDLQEPLRKIRGFSDMLVDHHSHNMEEEAHSILLRISNASQRLQRLIDDLLTYSRVSFQEQTRTPVDLNLLINEVISDLEYKIRESDVQVTVQEGLPVLVAQEIQMRQLFFNLISNGIKFRRSEVTPTIRVFYEPAETEGWVRIGVADNGIGFEMENLERILMPFQRLNRRSQYSGTGIGLALSRKIVEQHGGEITAESVVGEGTTFWVTLPIE